LNLVENELATMTGACFNGHSMVGALQCVLVCSPRTAGWNQPERAARWRELGFLHPPDFNTAQAQHEEMCRQLEAAGAGARKLVSGWAMPRPARAMFHPTATEFMENLPSRNNPETRGWYSRFSHIPS
jgi:arginine deiminase